MFRKINFFFKCLNCLFSPRNFTIVNIKLRPTIPTLSQATMAHALDVVVVILNKITSSLSNRQTNLHHRLHREKQYFNLKGMSPCCMKHLIIASLFYNITFVMMKGQNKSILKKKIENYDF